MSFLDTPLRRLADWSGKEASAWLALVPILAFGLFIRLDDLAAWHAQPNQGLAQGHQYYTTTYDGYYYFTLARDLAEGTPGASNERRGVPDGAGSARPLPPLLSVLAGGLARLSGWPVNSVGALLAPLLGVAVAIPVFLLGRLLGGRLTGLVAALFTLCVPYYAYRTNAGWVDTDGLNVFFSFLAAYWFAQFGRIPDARRYRYYVAGLLTWLLFLWWWDMAPGPLTAITFLPLAVALVFFYRPPRGEGLRFAVINGSALVLVLGVFGGRLWDKAVAQLAYVMKEDTGDFPNIGLSISEQKIPSFERIVEASTGEVYGFVFAALGLGLLVARRRALALFILAPVLLSLLSFLFAKRFLIFFAPIAGIGIGYLVGSLWEARARWFWIGGLAPVVALVAVFPIARQALGVTYWPKPRPPLIEVFSDLAEQTPEHAVIWAWWDFGYPIQYWGRRATLADGAYHPGELCVYLGYPLAAKDYRLAANFMEFFAVRGRAGMNAVYDAFDQDKPRGFAFLEQVLQKGPAALPELLAQHRAEHPGLAARDPEAWAAFFFPPPEERRPIFLLLNEELVRTAHWWFWFGTWDLAKRDGRHPNQAIYIPGLRRQGNRLLAGEKLELDLGSGQGRFGERPFALHRLSYFRQQGYRVRTYPRHAGQPSLTFYESPALGVLQDPDLAESVFGQLYFAQGQSSSSYFRATLYKTGLAQLWRVTGDRLPAEE